MKNYIRNSFAVIIVLAVAALSFTTSINAQSKSGYHIDKRILVGGGGSWDYLTFDQASNRLFVSHYSKVEVIDANTDEVIDDIPKMSGVHGIAIANEFGLGFISNGLANSVSVFDLKTLKITSEIPVGKNPDAILYDGFSHRVFVYNGETNDVSVIDAKEAKLISSVPLMGKPEFSATDLKGHIFVNLEDKNEVVCFDALSLNILGRWKLAGGSEPTGLAIDIEHNRLFSVCHNKLIFILDSETGAVIAKLPIGAKVDGCAFDPGTGLAFTSNAEGSITVVKEESPSKFSVLETIKTQVGAKTITLNPATHALYLPTAEFGDAPSPTKEVPSPKAPILPNSFIIIKLVK
jgi:YVTN family beta-propeller protein